VPKTDGSPRELRDHLAALEKIYQGLESPTPEKDRENLLAYTDAVAKTAAAIFDHKDCEPEIRQKAAEVCLTALHRRLTADPKSIDRFLEMTDRLEARGKGTPLAALAAFERVWGLAEAPDSALPDSNARFERFVKAVEQLGEVDPPHAQSAELLLKTAGTLEEKGQIDRAREMLELLKSRFPGTPPALMASGTLARFALRGQVLEDFAGDGLDGGRVDLKDFRGKVVLVDFWATWCTPCVKEFPAIKELAKQLESKGFVVLGIDVDQDPKTAKSFLASQEVNWPQIYVGPIDQSAPPSSLAIRLGVTTLPFKLVLDRSGRLVASGHSIDELKKVIELQLASPETQSGE
jgi:thiol-disulfide isomerase/thioredoxin